MIVQQASGQRVLAALRIAAWLLGCSACSDWGEQRPHGRVSLSLLHLSDLHSHVFSQRTRVSAQDSQRGLGRAGEWAEVSGLARLQTLVDQERAAAPRTLLIDSGDAVEGSAVYDTFGGAAELAGLSLLGVQAQALGNHDLSAGIEAARERYQRFAQFPVLASNYVPDGSALGFGSVVADSAWLVSGGLRVLVVGVGNADSVGCFSEDNSCSGVALRASAEAVQQAIDRARPFADFVVLTTHLGLAEDVDLIEHTTGVDALLGGHDHVLLDAPKLAYDCGSELSRLRGCARRSVPIVHSGAYGRYLGVLGLELSDEPAIVHDPADGFEVVAYDYRALPTNEAVAEAPAMLDFLGQFRAQDQPGRGLVAYAPAPIERFDGGGGDSALGNCVADVLRDALGSELSLFNSSTLRAELPAGPIDEATLFEALPFDDLPVELWLSREALEETMARAAARTAARDCQSALQIGGARLLLDCRTEAYALRSLAGACLAGECEGGPEGGLSSLATTEYVAGGGSDVLPAERSIWARTAEITVREALRERLRAAPPCGAAAGESHARACADADDCAGLGNAFECGGSEPRGARHCALRSCSEELEAFLRAECQAPLRSGLFDCSDSRRPALAAELCATLPCADARVGARHDGRIQVVWEP